jgi:signal transduction histidine kinase
MILASVNSRLGTLFRLIGLGLVTWTIVANKPAPATSGRGLVVLILLASGGLAWLAWTAWSCRQPALTPDLFIMAACGGLLEAASPGGAGSTFVFIAAIVAAVRGGLTRGLVIAAVGFAAVAAGAIIYDDSGLSVLVYTLGFCAITLAGSNLRQTQQRAEQAELLLAQTQRSHEEQLRSARMEESTRIARDIHDVLAHSLAGLAIQLEATDALLAQGAEVAAVRARVQRAHELARQGLNDARRAVGALRGDAPEPIGVRIEKIVADHSAIAERPAQLQIEGELTAVDARTGEAIVRTVQEALTNVRKHAPDARVSVVVAASADQVSVSVDDDEPAGKPADLAPTDLSRSGGGFGLIGMRERAEQLGGALEAGRTGSGWRVAMRVPIGENR